MYGKKAWDKGNEMPVYEYRCAACNHQFELRQKFSEAPADQCPKCGGAVHKMVSASAFSLKGAGWYGDGYGTKEEAPKSEADSAAGTGATAEAASTTPTDTSTTKETTAPPAPSSAQSQPETKSAVTEKAEKSTATEKSKPE